jgi:CMP-N-acetylneuraminic acid synthetase
MISVLIPARGGSKGLKNKNLCKIHGLSLIEISIIQARVIFGDNIKIYVSTENDEIKKHCEKKAYIINRPDELATDEATTIDVIKHSLKYIKDYYICLLQVTCPFRQIKKIKNELRGFYDSGKKCSFSAYRFHGFFYDIDTKQPINRTWKERPRRQDKKDLIIEDGSFYIFNRIVLEKPDFLWGIPYIFSGFNGIDIHDKDDLDLANAIWSRYWISQ